jgi:hypothetical protein
MATFNHSMKFGIAGTGVDKVRFSLNCRRLDLIYFLIYYLWKFSSGGEYTFLPTPTEVFFLPHSGRNAQLVDKRVPGGLLASNILVPDTSVLPQRPDDTLIPVFDTDADEPLFPQRTNVSADLTVADLEEFGEIAVGSITTIGVIQGMDLSKKDFLHGRKLV